MIGMDPVVPTCARAGCRAPATWSVVWRNPKIHSADRRKVWLACDEHVTYLREFLASRSFPLEVVEGVTDGAQGAS